jgi:hypothetical protein
MIVDRLGLERGERLVVSLLGFALLPIRASSINSLSVEASMPRFIATASICMGVALAGSGNGGAALLAAVKVAGSFDGLRA